MASAVPMTSNITGLKEAVQHVLESAAGLEDEIESLSAQVEALSLQKAALEEAAAHQAQELEALRAQLSLRAATPEPTARLTPVEVLRLLLERPGILQSSPLLNLANDPAYSKYITTKDLVGLAGELKNSDALAIKSIPFITATGQLSTGQGTKEESAWKNAVALLLVLLHHMTPEQYEVLTSVSRRHPGLASGEWKTCRDRLFKVYSDQLGQLEQVVTSIVPAPKEKIHIYVKVAAFMIVGRLVVSVC